MNRHIATAVVLIGCAAIVPVAAIADIAVPADTVAEDRAGAALIVSNAVIAYITGDRIATGRASTLLGCLGVGFGAGSIAMGAQDVTSYSGGVIALGGIATAIGLAGIVEGGRPASGDEDIDGGRGPVIGLGLVGAGAERATPGVVARWAF